MADIKPFPYEDWAGDGFILHGGEGGVQFQTYGTDGHEVRVDIAAKDVRQFTDAVHEQAGLPDRWALLASWLEQTITASDAIARTHGDAEAREIAAERPSAYRAVAARMTEIGAGR